MLSGLESEDCLFICAQVTHSAMQLRQHQTYQACEADCHNSQSGPGRSSHSHTLCSCVQAFRVISFHPKGRAKIVGKRTVMQASHPFCL